MMLIEEVTGVETGREKKEKNTVKFKSNKWPFSWLGGFEAGLQTPWRREWGNVQQQGWTNGSEEREVSEDDRDIVEKKRD